MAKPIVLKFGGAESSFDFAKLDRKKLYTTRRRQALDADGKPCRRASLTRDGRYLLQAGMTAQGYFDAAGAWVPNKALKAVDAEGNSVHKHPSTLGVAQEAALATARDLLDLKVVATYMLDPLEVDAGLQEVLDNGGIVRLPMVYRAGYDPATAYLLDTDNGLFLLTGNATPPEWVEPAATLAVIDEEEDDDDDDLDFDMF